MSASVTVHRIPWSTNVERVALAAGHKGIEVSWVDHPAHDRSGLVHVSGQPLAPVAELPDGSIVTDSPVILDALEALVPAPSLWPADPAERAAARILVEWFNAVWKVAPNAIAEAQDAGGGDPAQVAAWSVTLRESRRRFEALLAQRDHLVSDAFSMADVTVYPFLQYAARLEDGDPDTFHHVLHRELGPVDDLPRLADWITRIDARPRA